MSLEHAILGFLSYQPMSGYDLKKRFDESVRNFWPATQSQIYTTLKRLVEAGHARIEVVSQDDLPDRKVHHLTRSGLDELLAWLSEPAAEPPHRSAWLMQVFFAHHLPNAAILNLFRQRHAALAQKLEHFRGEVQAAIPRRYEELHSERMRTLWQLTLDNGMAHLACELAWLERAMAQIEALADL